MAQVTLKQKYQNMVDYANSIRTPERKARAMEQAEEFKALVEKSGRKWSSAYWGQRDEIWNQ